MTVYLVGAGPGDPDLITVRGAHLLAEADSVLYDHLAVDLLTLVRPGAELIDVGKRAGGTRVEQDEINALLIDRGRRFETVVRLKGGDPFVFAHGAEEVAALVVAGIPVEVVPGISAALGAPAFADVALTVRGVSRSFTVISGHDDPAEVPEERWQAIANGAETVVVMMGAAHIDGIAKRLIAAGMSPDTTVAAIRATRLDGSVDVTTLAEIGGIATRPPTTFVIGAVVTHRRHDGSPGAGAPDSVV